MDRTLSEVVALTGAKRRSVQLWADGKIIQAVEETDRAGTGVHRRFSENEVKIVALLVPLAELGLTIGWLGEFASRFRKAMGRKTKGQPESATTGEMRGALKRAARGEGSNFLLFGHEPKALWFDVLSGDEGSAPLDLVLAFHNRVFTGGSTFMGIIDLNATLKRLEP